MDFLVCTWHACKPTTQLRRCSESHTLHWTQLQVILLSSALCACEHTGGKNGVVAPDKTTFDYVKARTSEPFEAVYSDAQASFVADYR